MRMSVSEEIIDLERPVDLLGLVHVSRQNRYLDDDDDDDDEYIFNVLNPSVAIRA